MTKRKTDDQPVTDESLAQVRDEIAEAWAVEYQNPKSPYYPIPNVR